MYLSVSRPYSTGPLGSEAMGLMSVIQDIAYWIFVRFRDLGCVQDICEQRALTWESLIQGLRVAFEHASKWPKLAVNAATWLFLTHTHIVHLVSLAIFFGPIATLIPLLLLHELVVSILYNFSFIFHGLLRGTVEDHYLYLHSLFDDLKGSIFSSVDRLGAKYNALTTKFWPLVVLRLVCLGIGGLALYHITSETQRQNLPTAV